MKAFFVQVPEDYDKLYRSYSQQGYRVIAVGYKTLPGFSSYEVSFLLYFLNLRISNY